MNEITNEDLFRKFIKYLAQFNDALVDEDDQEDLITNLQRANKYDELNQDKNKTFVKETLNNIYLS